MLGLELALVYYNGQSTTTANKFKIAINKQLKLIKKNPYARSIRYDNVRFARIEKFPYAIHYSIDKLNDCVLVYKILCDYRDPDVVWIKPS